MSKRLFITNGTNDECDKCNTKQNEINAKKNDGEYESDCGVL